MFKTVEKCSKLLKIDQDTQKHDRTHGKIK